MVAEERSVSAQSATPIGCVVRIPNGFRKIGPNPRAGTALGHMSHHPFGEWIMTAVGAPARAVIAALLFGLLPVAEAAARPVNIVVIGDNNIRGRAWPRAKLTRPSSSARCARGASTSR
jgi:hypothetical protein